MENAAEQTIDDEEENLIAVDLEDTVETEETNGAIYITDVTVTHAEEPTGQTVFEVNAHDLSAFIALICGVIVFLVCASCGLGLYLLPLVAIVMGLIGLIIAKNAVNPQRAQLLSWLGLGSGIITVLLALIGIAVYIILIFGTVKAWGY
ncbi:MAG: hypothetical protein E4H27_09035 [Anaerolineales bacterium]|nr:MAG: hypothetical protein E4H27_09035 [Anaerolineales bacterium]